VTGKVLALFLAILMAGCIGKTPERITTEAMNKTNMTACGGIEDFRMRYKCMKDVAISSNNISSCDGINASEWRDDCITGFATKMGDLSLCEKIPGDAKKQVCYRSLN